MDEQKPKPAKDPELLEKLLNEPTPDMTEILRKRKKPELEPLGRYDADRN